MSFEIFLDFPSYFVGNHNSKQFSKGLKDNPDTLHDYKLETPVAKLH